MNWWNVISYASNRVFSKSMLAVKLLSDAANLPRRAKAGSVGYDLCSAVDCIVKAGHRAPVALDLVIQLPPGTYGRIAPKSDLALHHGIEVSAGVIDRDYGGNVHVILFNHDTVDYHVTVGQSVAQLIVEHAETPHVTMLRLQNDAQHSREKPAKETLMSVSPER